jgi:hypothetical protein
MHDDAIGVGFVDDLRKTVMGILLKYAKHTVKIRTARFTCSSFVVGVGKSLKGYKIGTPIVSFMLFFLF